MHLVCLGVMRRLLLCWLKGPLSSRLCARNVIQLSEELLSIRTYVSPLLQKYSDGKLLSSDSSYLIQVLLHCCMYYRRCYVRTLCFCLLVFHCYQDFMHALHVVTCWEQIIGTKNYVHLAIHCAASYGTVYGNRSCLSVCVLVGLLPR